MFLTLWLICGVISLAFIFAVRYVNGGGCLDWKVRALLFAFAVTGPFGLLINICFYSATFLTEEA